MGRPRKQKIARGASSNKTEHKMVETLDALAEFEDFRSTLFKKIQKMVKENWSPDRIRKEMAPYVQARIAMNALTGDPNAKTTLASQQDILDRHEGKATQKVEVTKRYQVMDQDELVALARQKLADAGIIEIPKTDVKKLPDGSSGTK